MNAHARADVPEHGTGTLLKHRGTLFALTAKHVADAFATEGFGQLSVFNPPQAVPRSEVDVVFEDDILDLAVLRLRRSAAARLIGIRPLELDDLGQSRNFERAVPSSGRLYILLGFPKQVRRVDDGAKKVDLSPLVVTGGVASNGAARLVLDYHSGLDGNEDIDPTGMSGALVFERANTRGVGRARAIAMMLRWNNRDRKTQKLVCSPIHGLRENIVLASGSSR